MSSYQRPTEQIKTDTVAGVVPQSLTDIGTWYDMRQYDQVMALLVVAPSSNDVVQFDLLGNPESDGSGTDVVLSSWTGAAGTGGDLIVHDITADDLGRLGGNDIRYVSARWDSDGAGVIASVVMLRMYPTYQTGTLTETVVA